MRFSMKLDTFLKPPKPTVYPKRLWIIIDLYVLQKLQIVLDAFSIITECLKLLEPF